MLPLLLAVAGAAVLGGSLQPTPTPDRVELLRIWVAAVEQHAPGQRDAALETARQLDLASIDVIDRHLPALVRTLGDPRATIFPARRRGTQGTASMVGNPVFTAAELVGLRILADEVRARGDANWLLKRAAVLHMDIAMSGGSPGAASSALRRLPLAQTTVFVEDGRQAALVDSIDHWEMARQTLDEIRSRHDRNPDPQKDPDVRLWYQATTSYLLSLYLVERDHFDKALTLFPMEADILFAAAAVTDMTSAPGVHSPLRRARTGFGRVMDLGSQESEMRAAVALFRRALEADRGHAEARIRIANLLGRLGRHDDALKELRLAIPLATDPLLQYYAHLFLGRELEQTNDVAGARAAYERAMTLAPNAQSPRVGWSQLLVRTGDRAAALDLLRPVLAADALGDNEPMWAYYPMAGREASILVERVYRTVEAKR
jgi:tetratricopeptide (TPR) repeat protein